MWHWAREAAGSPQRGERLRWLRRRAQRAVSKPLAHTLWGQRALRPARKCRWARVGLSHGSHHRSRLPGRGAGRGPGWRGPRSWWRPRTSCGWPRRGRRCTRWTRSGRGGRGGGVRGDGPSRSPAPGRRWSGSSASPSSPPRWGCRPTTAGGCSARRSSWSTGCPGCGRRVMAHELPAWRARRIARRTMELSRRGGRVRRRPDRPRRAPGRPGGGGPAHRRGDRPVHARDRRRGGRPAPPTAAASPSTTGRSPSPAPARSTASSTWPTPSTSTPRSPPAPPTSRSSGRPAGWMPAGPPRSARSPAPTSPSTCTARPHRRTSAGTRAAHGRRCSTCTSAHDALDRRRSVVGRVENTGDPGHRRPDPRLVRPTRSPDVVVKPVHRPRPSTSTSPPTRSPTGSPSRSHLRDQCVRLPLVHPPRPRLRHRPRHPPRPGRHHLLVQHRPAVPAPPPAQDPRRRLDLHRPRPRHLPVAQPARLPVPPRPHRHPRHHPRPTTQTRLTHSLAIRAGPAVSHD